MLDREPRRSSVLAFILGRSWDNYKTGPSAPATRGDSYGADARCELFHRGDRGDNSELRDRGTLVWTLVREDVDGRPGEDRGGQGGDAKAGAERVRRRARSCSGFSSSTLGWQTSGCRPGSAAVWSLGSSSGSGSRCSG